MSFLPGAFCSQARGSTSSPATPSPSPTAAAPSTFVSPVYHYTITVLDRLFGFRRVVRR